MIDRRSFVDVFSSVNGHDVVGTAWKKREAKIVASIDGVQRADHAKQTDPIVRKMKQLTLLKCLVPFFVSDFI